MTQNYVLMSVASRTVSNSATVSSCGHFYVFVFCSCLCTGLGSAGPGSAGPGKVVFFDLLTKEPQTILVQGVCVGLRHCLWDLTTVCGTSGR